MKNLINYFTLCTIILFSLSSCNSDEEIQLAEDPLKILVMGDKVHPTSESPYSYPYELWKKFVDDNKSIQLVGPNQWTRTAFPSFNNISYLNNFIYTFNMKDLPRELKVYTTNPDSEQPEVVLIGGGLGGVLSVTDVNDFKSTLNEIIDIVRVQNPDVKIYIERFAPWRTDRVSDVITQRTIEYYSAIDVTVTEKSTPDSQIVIIDMENNWKDEYWNNDRYGYNQAGIKEAVERTYNALIQ